MKSKIMVYVAVGIQLLAALIILVLLLYQKNVIRIFGGFYWEGETFIVPYPVILTEGIVLVLYIGFLGILQNNTIRRKTLAGGLLTGGACIIKIISGYTGIAMNLINRNKGAEYMAAYSVLCSAIEMAVTPLTLVSFALFCLATGMYIMRPDYPF